MNDPLNVRRNSTTREVKERYRAILGGKHKVNRKIMKPLKKFVFTLVMMLPILCSIRCSIFEGNPYKAALLWMPSALMYRKIEKSEKAG